MTSSGALVEVVALTVDENGSFVVCGTFVDGSIVEVSAIVEGILIGEFVFDAGVFVEISGVNVVEVISIFLTQYRDVLSSIL